MSASPVAVCNLALSWLAGNRILSLDDDSDEARHCKANYDPSRRAVLEGREWTFAVKRAQLPALAEPPLFGWTHKFLLPSDCLYSIGVYDPGHSNRPEPPQIQHRVEQREVLAWIKVIHMKYIINIEDTTKFSPLFDQTLAAHIAMNIAIPLTENSQHYDRMATLYQFNLDAAAASDGMQGTREHLDRSQMEESRRMFVTPR